MTWGLREPDFVNDHPPRCYVDDCPKPGRFFVGHGAIMYTFCVDHIEPRGIALLMQTVEGVRDILRSTDLSEGDPQ